MDGMIVKVLSISGLPEAIPAPGYAQKSLVGNLLRFISGSSIDFASP
jgi:hypothetical protein